MFIFYLYQLPKLGMTVFQTFRHPDFEWLPTTCTCGVSKCVTGFDLVQLPMKVVLCAYMYMYDVRPASILIPVVPTYM